MRYHTIQILAVIALAFLNTIAVAGEREILKQPALKDIPFLLELKDGYYRFPDRAMYGVIDCRTLEPGVVVRWSFSDGDRFYRVPLNHVRVEKALGAEP